MTLKVSLAEVFYNEIKILSLLDNGGCSHICINTFGRSFCSCPEGMELSGDFKTCQGKLGVK